MPKTHATRILIVDDHEVVRMGIGSVLAAEPTITICGKAVDGRDAIEKARALSPDVVVMDISMPNMNGLDATREIKRLLPQSEVVIVSQHNAPEMIRQAFHAGARGYVVKSAIATDLLAAIAKTRRHEPFLPESMPDDANVNLDAAEILRRSQAYEKALREGEEPFRSAMNSMAEGLYTLNTEGLVTYVNSAAETLFGWTSGELLGKKMHDVTHYKHLDGKPFPAADCPGLQVLQKGIDLRGHEDFFIRKDGTFFPVVFSASPIRTGSSITGVVVCFRDDTKRRQTEEYLREREGIFRAIGESIDYGIWICDAKGRNIYASASFLQLVGLTQEQCSEFGWGHALHPEDVDSTMAAWQECVSKGELWEREHRLLGVDGNWHFVLARGGPIRNGEGRILYWAGINMDIQLRKEAERKLNVLVQTLEGRIAERTRELEHATDKLRDLSGKLMQAQDEERRRIARELHDGVGQLLAAMNMNLSNLWKEKSKLSANAGQSLQENAALIQQAAQEIRTLSHLLHPPLLDEVGLESALCWYLDGFSKRSKITIQTQMEPGFSHKLPRECALALFRIAQESLTNVYRHSGSPSALVAINRSPSEITMEVKDEGRGIPEEIQAEISSGESSGVGLRGMRERARQFGGRLEVHSHRGCTRIVAVLPVPEMADTTEETEAECRVHDQEVDQEIADRTLAEQLAADQQDSLVAVQAPLPDAATILCIDDESVGVTSRKLLLESAGHRVREASSGEEGIRIFQSEKIDVVILDYWMSGMKGTAVASELKRINPAVPIIVLSGMFDLPGEASGIVDQWLVKGSHRAEHLLDSIHTLLQRRRV